jgi:membrane complex biogenesis BtpA family protein
MHRAPLIASVFGVPRALIGMLHLRALPGTPSASEPLDAIVERAVAEARIYRDAGFHGLMIENMHDRPYLKGHVGPEVVAAMTLVGAAVRHAAPLPLGVQVLAGANHEALAVAHASGAAFARVEGFVFAHVADEGVIESRAGELLRFRRSIGADRVKIFADVKKKHAAHALTADVDLVESARAAEFFLADAVIVTGVATGREADSDEVAAVAHAVSVPTLVGSGVTSLNMARYPAAAGFIVGSSVKVDGIWWEQLDPARVAALVEAFARATSGP